MHFTSRNKPGVLVSDFESDPHRFLDGHETPIACFAGHVEINWVFLVSILPCFWRFAVLNLMEQWPGYDPKPRVTKLYRGYVLRDLALDLCEAIDELMTEVAKVRSATINISSHV